MVQGGDGEAEAGIIEMCQLGLSTTVKDRKPAQSVLKKRKSQKGGREKREEFLSNLLASVTENCRNLANS